MPRLAVSSACWLTAALLCPVGRAAAQDSLGAATQDSVSPSPGLTPERVARGRALFHGVGGCAACHGDDGVGTTEGPSLVTGPWTLGDGSLAWLTHMTRHGGWGSVGRDGEPRRMRGPTVLDSAQVSLAAEYVFSISRKKTRERPDR
jgi:mono/diheme cytochrome c family protein